MRAGSAEREDEAVILRSMHELGRVVVVADLFSPLDLRMTQLLVLIRQHLRQKDCGVNGEVTSVAVGGWLRRHKDAIIDGHKLVDCGKDRSNRTKWKAIKVGADPLALPAGQEAIPEAARPDAEAGQEALPGAVEPESRPVNEPDFGAWMTVFIRDGLLL